MTGLGRQQFRKAEFYGVAVAVLFVAVIAVSGIFVGFQDVLARLALLSPQLVAGLLALSLVNYACRTWRWHLFGQRLGISPHFGRTVLVYVAGFAMTPTPGKLGEALRLWLLERTYGFRYARTMAAMIGDRIGDMAVVLALCLFGVGAYAGYEEATMAAAAVVLLVAMLFVRTGPLLKAIGAVYATVARWPRLFASARHAVRQTASLFSPSLIVAALALGGLGWLAECFGLYWLINELGAPISLQGSVFVFAFSLLVGAVSMLPGGLGSTEATMFALLSLADVPPDIALAATAVSRAATLWFAVLLGAAVLPAALRMARGGSASLATHADSRA